MDFATVITNRLANERTHMDFLLSSGATALPAIVANADVETRRYFLNIALNGDTYDQRIAHSLVNTLSGEQTAPETLAVLDEWLLRNPGHSLVNLLIPDILDMKVPLEDRYRVVIRSLTSPELTPEIRHALIERATTLFAFDADMARSLLDALGDFTSNNRRASRSAFAALVSHSLDKDVTLEAFRRGLQVEAPSRLIGALATSPILTSDLAVTCLTIAEWDTDSVSTFLRETVSGNMYSRVKSGDAQTLSAEQTREVARIVRDYILDPANSVPVIPRTIAVGYLFGVEPPSDATIALIASTWQEVRHTVDLKGNYQARKIVAALTESIVKRNIYRLYPDVYASAQSDDQSEKELRSLIITRISEITTETNLTSDEALALWDLVCNGRTVSATSDAQDALIKCGRLPRETMEEIASRRGRLGVTAKAQIALQNATPTTPSGDETAESPQDSELWDVAFGPRNTFAQYAEAAVEIGGLTPIGALGAYVADMRMTVEARTEARDLLVSLANHNPDYAVEVPDAAWGAMMRVQSPIALSPELTERLMTLGPDAQRLASKQLVNIVLV